MAERSNVLNQFSGGISESEALGSVFSFKFAKHLNIHEDPSFATLHRKTTKVSGSTVVDLPLWMVDASPWATDRFFFGDTGKFYKETSGGTWSVISTQTSSSGNGIAAIDDYIYLANDATLDRYGPLSNSPSADNGFIEDDTINIMETNATSGQIYTTTTGVNEGATHRRTMTKASNKDPFKEVDIEVVAKGSGDVTVTVHDSQNVSIGTATILTASVTASAVNTWTFTAPGLELDPDETYHFHVHSTVADTTLVTGTTVDLETVDCVTYWSALKSDDQFHPMVEHIGKLVIGNERWLATQEGSVITTYDPNRVFLARGFRVRALAKDNEFVVAAAWRGPNVDEVEEARLFWWDGTSRNFNFSRPINAGLIHCLHTDSKGRLVAVMGNEGEIHIGNGAQEFTKIQRAPSLVRGKKLTLAPGAITEWQQRTHIAYALANDDSTGIVSGVYEFGHGSAKLPEVLNFAYTISTGTEQDTDMKIGLVKGIGDDMYIGWLDGDGSTYGVDKINIADNPAVSATYESLIISNGNPSKDKQALELFISHAPLVTNESMTLKYQINRSGSFTTGTSNTTVGATETIFPINARYKEIEIGFDFATTATTYPKITSIGLTWDDLGLETNEPTP